MSKLTYLYRYTAIINQLKATTYVSFNSIQKHLAKQELLQKDAFNNAVLTIDKRTFQRDVVDIKKLFGITISYNRQHKGYTIEEEQSTNQSLLQHIELLWLTNGLTNYKKYISLQNNKAYTNLMLYIITAIQHKKQLQFIHTKYGETPNAKQVEPYGIKEFNEEWYLIGKDKKDNCIKAFGLDRVSQLIEAAATFTYPKDFSITSFFKNYYGIITQGTKVEKVTLVFDAYQAYYILAKPIHSSQQIVHKTSISLTISVHLVITYDFVMLLLSYGNTVKVITPKKLQNKLLLHYKNTLALYK